MTALKRFLWILIALPILLIGLAALLLFTLDPNRLKPMLVKVASERNINLDFGGDLQWHFYPYLGVTLGQLTASTVHGAPLAEVGKAGVRVKLLPLLHRSIEVDGISLSEAKVHVLVDAQGASNWDVLSQSDAPADAKPSTDGDTPNFTVDRINASDLSISYQNAQNQQEFIIDAIQLAVEQFSLTGKHFPVDLKFAAKLTDLPEFQIGFIGPVGLNLEQQIFTTDGAKLEVGTGIQQATINLTTETHWGDAFTSQGKVSLQPTALKGWANALEVQLPLTQASNALTHFSLTSDYTFNSERFNANEIEMTLDKTGFNGSLMVADFNAPKIKTHWLGGAINLDDYLPPLSEQEAEAAAPPTAPTPLPLDTLRALNLDLRLALRSISTKELTFSQPTIVLTADKGLFNIKEASTQVADGQVMAKGTFDARADEAKLNMTVDGDGVNVGQLLTTFADIDNISGLVFADATITSHGTTDKALADNLEITAEAESQALQFVPINIERAYCQAVALLQQKTPPEFDWPKLTKLEPLKLNLQLKGSQLELTNLTAQISKLIGEAHGNYNLDSGQFNIPFTLKLGDFGGDIEGCTTIPEKWRKRELPIRCKGSLDELGLKTCLPDTELLTNMVKDKIDEAVDKEKARANAKIEQEKDRAEAKLKEKAQELLDKNLEEDEKKAVEDKLKNLFKDLKNK